MYASVLRQTTQADMLFSMPELFQLAPYRSNIMNKDQVEGKLKDIGGKIQEQVGDLIDSPEQEAKGLQKQAEGKLQEKVGDLKEAVHIATK